MNEIVRDKGSAAGGWGALKSCGKHLAQDRRALFRRPGDAEGEPARRLRLPRLRLARPRARLDLRVLRERRQGRGLRRRPTQRVDAGVLRRAHRRRAAPAGATIALEDAGPPDRSDASTTPPATGTSPIDWDDAFALIAQRPARRCQPRTRPSSTPRAAPATRPRSSTSCSCASTAPTTSPTARTCATRRAASALRQQIGVGKGTVHARRLRAGRRDLRLRPEPRHQPSAHARRPAPGRASAARRSSCSTRCASAGWSASPTRRTSSRCYAAARTPIATPLLPAAHRRRHRGASRA